MTNQEGDVERHIPEQNQLDEGYVFAGYVDYEMGVFRRSLNDEYITSPCGGIV